MYDHQKEEKLTIASPTVVTTSTGIVSRNFAVQQPFIVRSIAACVVVAPGTTPPVLNFKRRPTPASATGEVSIGTLTIPTTAAVGSVYYKTGFSTKIFPGEELVVDVTTASVTTGTVVPSAHVEPSWEAPANNVEMILSA